MASGDGATASTGNASLTATAGNIFLGAALTATSGSATLQADDSISGAGTVTGTSVSLTATTGNVGASGAAINTATGSLTVSATAATTNNGNAFVSNTSTGVLTLNDANFTVNKTLNLTNNNGITTSGGTLTAVRYR